MTKVICFSCGQENTLPGIVGLREECSRCGSDLHVCKTCLHYDPKVYNECKEPQAEVVREKERSNFCDYYTPAANVGVSGKDKDALRAAAEALFKKKSE